MRKKLKPTDSFYITEEGIDALVAHGRISKEEGERAKKDAKG